MELFDWEYYLENNIDLKENNILTKEAVLIHWEQYGKIENRIHRFNRRDNSFVLNLFLKNLIDSENKGELTKIDAWDILSNIFNKKDDTSSQKDDDTSSQKDDDTSSQKDDDASFEKFDWKYYLDNNEDLIKNGIVNQELAYQHWIENGKFEDRKYRIIKNITFENFDWKYYIIHNLDLLENNILSKEKLWNHWINYGTIENRSIRTINNKINDTIDNKPIDIITNTSQSNNYINNNKNIENENQKAYYNISNDKEMYNEIYNEYILKKNKNISENTIKIIDNNINTDSCLDINTDSCLDINTDSYLDQKIDTNIIYNSLKNELDLVNTNSEIGKDDIKIDEIYNDINYVLNPSINNKYIFNPNLYKNNNINLIN
jgi:hypothetical protein